MAKLTCIRRFRAYDVYKNGEYAFTGTAREISAELGVGYTTISRYARRKFTWHCEYTFTYSGTVERECKASGGGKRKEDMLMPVGTRADKWQKMYADGSKWQQYVGMYEVGDMTPWGQVVEVTDRLFRVVRGRVTECYSWIDMMIGGVNTDESYIQNTP